MRQSSTAPPTTTHAVLSPQAVLPALSPKLPPPHEERLRKLLEELPQYILTPQTRTPSWKIFLKQMGIGLSVFSPLFFFLPVGVFLSTSLSAPNLLLLLLGLLTLIVAIWGLHSSEKISQSFKTPDTAKSSVHSYKQVILKLIRMSEDEVLRGRLAELFPLVASCDIDRTFWSNLAKVSRIVSLPTKDEDENFIESLQQHYRNHLVSKRVSS